MWWWWCRVRCRWGAVVVGLELLVVVTPQVAAPGRVPPPEGKLRETDRQGRPATN